MPGKIQIRVGEPKVGALPLGRRLGSGVRAGRAKVSSRGLAVGQFAKRVVPIEVGS
jgi:hypothetical protein